jgi:hypothetical protein
MTADIITHELAFAVRFEDHFSREPVAETLAVALDTGERPVAARAGGFRHDDGTYRWADLASGLRVVSFASSSGRWVRLDVDPIEVSVPIADPQTAVRVELWPTAIAAPSPGVPAIRGKLVGANVVGLRVEIDGTATTTPTGRWTRADGFGELLFPLPGGPWPTAADGTLDLTVVVPGRTVTSVDLLPGPTTFVGDRLFIPPDRDSRVRIHVT